MKVAVVGYSEFEISSELKELLKNMLVCQIESGAEAFYFCDGKDGFDKLCYEAVDGYMPRKIKCVLVRAHYECKSIEEDIFEYILEFTEGRAFYDNPRQTLVAYIKPVRDIINLSDVLFTCYNPQFESKCYAVKYAKMKKKKIINVFELL